MLQNKYKQALEKIANLGNRRPCPACGPWAFNKVGLKHSEYCAVIIAQNALKEVEDIKVLLAI